MESILPSFIHSFNVYSSYNKSIRVRQNYKDNCHFHYSVVLPVFIYMLQEV